MVVIKYDEIVACCTDKVAGDACSIVILWLPSRQGSRQGPKILWIHAVMTDCILMFS